MADIKLLKNAWRRLAADMFGLVERGARRDQDRVLTERLREYVFARGARTLLGFGPLSDEPDVSDFFRRWLDEGGKLALPVWLGGSAMQLRQVNEFDRLTPGRSGILEPLLDSPEVEPEEVDIAVVPGRLFSEKRQRLGRGAGCYDALFGGRKILRLGVAYDFQVYPELPTVESDQVMDMIVTPTRIITGS